MTVNEQSSKQTATYKPENTDKQLYELRLLALTCNELSNSLYSDYNARSQFILELLMKVGYGHLLRLQPGLPKL